MSKNVTKKTLVGQGTHTLPSGVKKIKVHCYGIPNGGSNAIGEAAVFSNFISFPTGNLTKKLNDNNFGGNEFHYLHSRAAASCYDGVGDYSCLIAPSGLIMTVGRNNKGQLGDGTTVDKAAPVSTGISGSFVNVIGSNEFPFFSVLKSDGSVWSWGEGTYGMIGNNSIANKSTPTQAIGGHSFVRLSSNNLYTMTALKSDGSVWSWGMATDGALGDNTIANKSTPVQVVGGHSFVQICGLSALKSDGSVWSWGSNWFGDLGDGTTTNRSSPVQLIGGHSFVQIGYNKALKSDGSVWSWGMNGYWNGSSYSNVSSPVQIVASFKFKKIVENNLISENNCVYYDAKLNKVLYMPIYDSIEMECETNVVYYDLRQIFRVINGIKLPLFTNEVVLEYLS